MNGSPRCQNCGSWNTVLIPATYGERVKDTIVKGTGLTGVVRSPRSWPWSTTSRSSSARIASVAGTISSFAGPGDSRTPPQELPQLNSPPP
jgi:hypothetical protein